MRKRLVLVLLISLVVIGCATQRYGRLVNVSASEKKYLTCKQIDMEIDKAQEFISQTTEHKKRFTGKDVLAFLGDFGIGNNWEYNDAIKSADNRINQLMDLRRERGCD